MLMIGLLALVGVRGPLNALRRGVEGYELWLAFVVASIATGGSLFLSEIAHFVPASFAGTSASACIHSRSRRCWRHCSTIHAPPAYLLPLPVVGAGVSVYHLLVENGVVGESLTCRSRRRAAAPSSGSTNSAT
jgi:hypothetical protein